MLIKNDKTRGDFPFAYWADRLYQGVSFAEDIYGFEKNSRGIA